MRSQRKLDQGVATRRHTTLTLMDALDKARLSLHRNVTATDDELEETWETVKEKMAEVARIAHRLKIGGRLKFELGIDPGAGQGTRTIDNTDEIIDAYEMLGSCDDSTAFVDAWLDFGDGEPIDLGVAMTKQQLDDRMGRQKDHINEDMEKLDRLLISAHADITRARRVTFHHAVKRKP